MVIVVGFFSEEAEVGNFAAASSLPWKLLYIQNFVAAAAHSVLELCHCTLPSVCCETFGMTFICTNWGSCPDILNPWLLSWFSSRKHIIFVQNVFFSHSPRWCLKWAFRLFSTHYGLKEVKQVLKAKHFGLRIFTTFNLLSINRNFWSLSWVLSKKNKT